MSPINQEFYLVRHGIREDHQKYGVERAREMEIDDPPLSEDGKKQAVEIVNFFRKRTVNHIFSSPYSRCLQTVEPLAELLNIKIKIENGLRECFAEYTKYPVIKPLDKVLRNSRCVEMEYKSRKNPGFPETLIEMYERSGETVRLLANEFTGSIVCFAHEYTVVGGVRGLLKKSIEEMPLACPTAAIFQLHRENAQQAPHDKKWELRLNADVSHLSNKKNSFIGVEDNEIELWLHYHNLSSLEELL